MNLLMDPEIDFVTLTGTAGTGKTLLALAAGLTQVLDDRYTEIIMTRATVSVGEDIGFLPGTEEEKMGPWMGALDDNLEFLAKGDGGNAGEWGRAATNELIRSRIKIKSMNFMRGRTFLNKYVIIDEAQNLTPKQMKTLITRAGPGIKIICMGQPGADRYAVPHRRLVRPDVCSGPLQGLATQRPHYTGARRTFTPGGLRQRSALSKGA
jgi:PhoH-like ATPase